jgi:hypothetical protein
VPGRGRELPARPGPHGPGRGPGRQPRQPPRPGAGRVGKVSLVAIVLLAVTSHLAPELTGPALVGGAGVGMLWPRPAGALHARGHRLRRSSAGAGLGLVRRRRGRGGSPSSSSPRSTWPAGGQLQRRDRPDPPLRWLDRLGAPLADREGLCIGVCGRCPANRPRRLRRRGR